MGGHSGLANVKCTCASIAAYSFLRGMWGGGVGEVYAGTLVDKIWNLCLSVCGPWVGRQDHRLVCYTVGGPGLGICVLAGRGGGCGLLRKGVFRCVGGRTAVGEHDR